MKLLVAAHDAPLLPATRLLLQRLSAPFSGLDPHLAFALRSDHEPRVAVACAGFGSAALAHHVAGVGASSEEAVIAALAESVERNAPRLWATFHRHKMLRASFRSMQANGQGRLAEHLQCYSWGQLGRSGFPFSRLDPDTVISWVPMQSLVDGTIGWLPAQVALVGDISLPDEPRFAPGVTTGTAAHRTIGGALRNALLELVQIDAAMGHWFGARSCSLIQHDERTAPVAELMRRQLRPHGPVPRFHWLPSADLPGFVIACVVESPEVPRGVVGLGCELRLGRAMYKAYLEAIAVIQLAKLSALREARRGPVRELDPLHLYDFDSNVAYYSTAEREDFRVAFHAGDPVVASELPPDVDLGESGDLRTLEGAFKESGKGLAFLDLTTPDIKELGLRVVRVWSPETLSLSPPGAPPVLHPRFRAYGGVTHERAHPYP